VPYPVAAQQEQDPRPVFRSEVSRVTVAATVRDRRGRPVTSLTADDFHLFDGGIRRDILDFRRDSTAVSVAILTDVSGSMDLGGRRQTAEAAAGHILNWLDPAADKVGLYAFDQWLQEVAPLQAARANLLESVTPIKPWGRTRLFDAIAETAQRVAGQDAARRAVIVLTDGDDNASELSAGEVSGLASSIDVPVYVLVMISPLDRSGNRTLIDDQLAALRDGALGQLARWTGGDIVLPASVEATTTATRQIVNELRQQYLLVFEPSAKPGWHRLELRTRQDNLVVRARSGYVVPDRTDELRLQ
jgi:Ca-activated chloride channel family protein